MPTPLPEAVLRSERIYRGLLRFYPKSHRQEFGAWMTQVFRDLCRQAYHTEGYRGLMKVWLRTFPDLAWSAIQEHEYEMRRWMVDSSKSHDGVNPRWVIGLLVSASIIALGVIGSVVVRQAGGPVAAALVVAIGTNLAGALVFDLFSRRDGAVLGAMGLLMLLGTLPLLWVPDQAAWMRENPMTFGVVILLAGYVRQRYSRNWPLFAVGLILGAAHILISLW